MILSFSTQLNGKPTYFVEKIWQGFPESDQYIEEWFTDGKMYEQYDFHPDAYGMFPKIHTIREDKTERWKKGVMIDFFINARQKNMFRFAPRIPVVSKQRIFMTYLPQCGLGFRVSINGRELEEFEVEKLAINDGFDAVEDFENYFIKQMIDDQFSGKIIHWTDFKY